MAVSAGGSTCRHTHACTQLRRREIWFVFPPKKRGRETQNQAVRLSRYKRRGSWFFHEVDLSHIWSFATEAVEQSLPERMERWWFPTQMLRSSGLLDPIRGHISHQPRRDALSLLTTFLFFSHRVIWPQLIFICCLMSPRRSFPPPQRWFLMDAVCKSSRAGPRCWSLGLGSWNTADLGIVM